jgi:DNA-binding CsgD family transcriptional regulator
VSEPLDSLDLHERLLTDATRLEARDPEVAARLFAEASVAALEGGEVEAGVAAAEHAARIASVSAPQLLPLARLGLASANMLAGREEEARALLDECLEQLDTDALVEAVSRAAGLLFWIERYAAAAELLERAVEAGRRADRPDLVARPLDTLGSIDYRLGRWGRGAARSREALRLARLSGSQFDANSALTTQARFAAARGDEESCRRLLAAVSATEPESGLVRGYAATAAALLALSLDRADEAIAHLEPLRDLVLSRYEPAVFLWEGDLIEAYLRVGRRRDATAVLASLEQRAVVTRRSWALATAARSRGLLSPAETLDEHFSVALHEHERVPMPFERARTELSYGARLRRARRSMEARPHLQSALATFERLGAEPWAARTRRELASKAARNAPGSHEASLLTPHELQVATLVVRGMTNREAAAALFVTPKTIEYHLASIYRKLEVRSRTELAFVLQGRPGRSAR